jgi:hypothetical protein
MGAVQNDVDPISQVKCIWGIFLCLYYEGQSSKQNLMQIDILLDSLSQFVTNPVKEVSYASHDAILSLSQLGILGLIDSKSVDKMIISICTQFNKHFEDNEIRISMILNIYHMLTQFCLSISNQTLLNANIMGLLFISISHGLDRKKIESKLPKIIYDKNDESKRKQSVVLIVGSQEESPQKLSKEVESSAQVLLLTIINMRNNFPLPTGCEYTSTKISEFGDNTDGLLDIQHNVFHYSLNNNTLLSVLESPSSNKSTR